MFHFFSNIQNRISFKFINFIILNYRSKRSTKEVDSLDHIQNQILLKLDPRHFFTLDSKRVNTASCNSKKMNLSRNIHDVQNLPRCALFQPL